MLELSTLVSINVKMEKLEEKIMQTFLHYYILRHTLSKDFGGNYDQPGITISDKPTHLNITQSIFYEIPKTCILKYFTFKKNDASSNLGHH